MFFLPNLFYILAFFAGTFVVWKLFREENYDEEKVIDLVLFSTLVGIFFGRLFYLFSTQIFNFQFSIFNFFTSLFFSTNGGFSVDAGLFAFLLFAFFFLRRNKWPNFPALDFLSLGAFIAVTIVHLGFFIVTLPIRHLLFTFYFLFFTFVFFFLRQYYYKKGRIFSLALLLTLHLPLVLTGAISFYIIDGKEYVAEFVKGFRSGLYSRLNLKTQNSNVKSIS